MRSSLRVDELTRYTERQLATTFPDDGKVSLHRVVGRALDVVEFRFSRIKLRSYRDEEGATFNHLHSDQYASYVYECSRIAFRDFGDVQLAEKLFGLNKAINGIVCMYDTELPNLFIFIHTVGSVLGKARYGEKLVVCQGVTVGTDRGKAPSIGEGVVLFGGSTVIGDAILGDRSVVSTGTVVRSCTVPAGHVAAGREPTLIVKAAKRNVIEGYF
jgi:serine O-acetyltransferase